MPMKNTLYSHINISLIKMVTFLIHAATEEDKVLDVLKEPEEQENAENDEVDENMDEAGDTEGKARMKCS